MDVMLLKLVKSTGSGTSRGASKTVLDLAGRYPLPNLVEIMVNLMERTTPPVRLTRATLLEVFKRIKNKKAATDNPQEFATVAVRIIKDKLADHLVNGIQYEKISEWYEMTQPEAEIESWMDYLVPASRFCISCVRPRTRTGKLICAQTSAVRSSAASDTSAMRSG